MINHHGTYVDGLKISEVTIDEFGLTSSSPLQFRFAVEEDAEHVGGFTIFGKTFGNYAQDINVGISYAPV